MRAPGCPDHGRMLRPALGPGKELSFVGPCTTPSVLGRLAERPIAPAPKAVPGNTDGGSNPSPSANMFWSVNQTGALGPRWKRVGGFTAMRVGSSALRLSPCPRRLIGLGHRPFKPEAAGSSPVEGTPHHAALVQLGARRPLKAEVTGSKPVRGTQQHRSGVAQLVEQAAVNRKVGGSRPSLGASRTGPLARGIGKKGE